MRFPGGARRHISQTKLPGGILTSWAGRFVNRLMQTHVTLPAGEAAGARWVRPTCVVSCTRPYSFGR